MNFLRSLYRHYRPADPREKLFDVQPTVDRKPTITSALSHILRPELLSIVAAYAGEFICGWNDALTYDTAIQIAADRLICRSSMDGNRNWNWNRIVASEPIVVGGTNRWRIKADFTDRQVGYVAVGISASRRPFDGYGSSFGPNDFLVFAADNLMRADLRVYVYQNDDWTTIDHRRWTAKPDRLETVLLVACGTDLRSMTVSFLNDDDRICDVCIRLPTTVDRWFACVGLFGMTSATMLAWPDV